MLVHLGEQRSGRSIPPGYDETQCDFVGSWRAWDCALLDQLQSQPQAPVDHRCSRNRHRSSVAASRARHIEWGDNAKNLALLWGDYTTMSAFDYDYSPASGEDQVPASAPAVAAAPTQVFEGEVTPAAAAPRAAAGGIVQVPAAALRAASSPGMAPRVAEITLNLAHSDQGRRFRVLVSPGGGAAPVAAGAITVFGHPHDGPTTFTVSLPENLGVTAVTGNVPLDVRVVPIGPTLDATATIAVTTAPQVNAILVRID